MYRKRKAQQFLRSYFETKRLSYADIRIKELIFSKSILEEFFMKFKYVQCFSKKTKLLDATKTSIYTPILIFYVYLIIC